jgi:pimeloyl-ACP methyl ester carboxylesterase
MRQWETRERTRASRELPRAHVLELHGANHYVFASNPGEVTGAMRAFLGRD